MGNNVLQWLYSFIEQQAISILLSVLGIAVTIFTVIYSFVYSDKGKLKELAEEIKQLTERNPVLEAERLFMTKKIQFYKRINCWVVILIAFTLLSLVFFIIHSIFVYEEIFKLVTVVLLGLDVVILVVFLFYYIIDYFKRVL
jgi:Na+/melibiose symporter-like transporter